MNICACQNQKIVSDTANCSDKSCVIKTYHLSCLGLEEAKKVEIRNQNRHFSKIFFGMFYDVTATGNRVSAASMYIFEKRLSMNQIFKAFKTSVIKILEKHL